MNIINIVDNLTPINYGIWNAAINTSPILKSDYNITSWLVYPPIPQLPDLSSYQVKLIPLNQTFFHDPAKILATRDINPQNAIIVTHGCWMQPSRVGAKLKQSGYHWIFTPHGMLEPWPLKHKKYKKLVYYHLREKWLIKNADVIRAVGLPEKNNLNKKFPEQKVNLIPNGVNLPQSISDKDLKKKTILFLSRLHSKKGVLPLVQAFIKSVLFEDPEYELIVAGPDEGELPKMMAEMNHQYQYHNIKYMGSVYNQEKENLLQSSAIFILPSFSEGFPTSVVEAMGYGLIPIITPGCNFPEVFDKNLGFKTSTDQNAIIQSLNQLKSIPNNQLFQLSRQNHQFIANHYSLHHIATQQSHLAHQLLKG